MAQSTVFEGQTLILPGSYPSIKVQSNASGLATTGVLMLVGEADAGDDYSLETDLESNAFGPDQLADVIAKYGSGPLVDAFRAACAPSTELPGSFASAILVKTNVSTKASGPLLTAAPAAYSTLYAKQAGKALVTYSVSAATSEVVPTTGPFTYIPSVGTVNWEFRANGGAALPVSVTASALGTLTETPTQFVSAVNALSGVDATGGVSRGPVSVSGTLALDANPIVFPGTNNVLITRSIAWTASPVVGDTLYIPTGSILAGGADANVGAYVVVSVGTATVTATKLSDAGKNGAAINTISTPADVGATPIAAVTDLACYSPVVIVTTAPSDPGAGVGQSLEIAQPGTGTDLISRCAFTLNTTVVPWISATGAPVQIVSAAEYKAQLNVARSSDGANEVLAAGGEVALNVGYVGGTTATLTVDKGAGTLYTTVVGGSGLSIPAIKLTDYPTLTELVTFLSMQTGYTASVSSPSLGNLPPSALDAGTYGICSTWGAKNGRIKVDAYKWFNKLLSSLLVQQGSIPAAANAGIPAVKALAYMTGGAKGFSTAAQVSAAVDALENVRGNFVIPLFSRDASLDVTAGLSEAGSTYTIDAVNLAVKSHVLKMSTLKRRGNRLAFLSKEDTFANQKTASGNTASSRCSMTFEDFKQLGGDGNIGQFQPWMGAVLAAAMQAAGFYKAIFFKGINTAGVVHAAGDFNQKSDSQMEEALLAGLLPARKSLTGGFIFESDQTTYTKDNNFVFNSIQAMYAADIIALSTAQRMEAMFVGQSTADTNAALALSALENIMADFLRLKLIAPSDDALRGFKNAKIKLNGGSLLVSVEVKLAGGIYFVPISFLVSQVTQSA